ncbi:hypothetical protein SAMN06265222_1233 [Neorhodopirellula lusitana]|uniref:Uncharacterized protein n=1 Tax=Neorhodopirellula lusitana TaxID=445327 RepID=A0ABY1QPL8_9BACT|nr:hypothetical protein SAMN06265222_1233 [Neorhodopirellula lusitana]
MPRKNLRMMSDDSPTTQSPRLLGLLRKGFGSIAIVFPIFGGLNLLVECTFSIRHAG